jgi:hypothetical protein
MGSSPISEKSDGENRDVIKAENHRIRPTDLFDRFDRFHCSNGPPGASNFRASLRPVSSIVTIG